MKLLNNLCSLLNKQFLNTNTNYFPCFNKGELCIDSINHISGIYVVKRIKKNTYNIYWASSEAHIKDVYDPHMIATWGHKTEKEVVALFK